MKIVFIGSRDIHLLGGIENYMYNLSTKLVQMGHEAVVFCESDHKAVETVNGVKVIYMKGPKSNLLCKPIVGLKATLRTIFREKEVSLIHYNAWPPSLWSWIATLAGIPSVMMGHGHEWQRSKYSPRQQKILKMMERYTAHSNKHLLMCSDAQTRYFAEHYKVQAYTMPTAVDIPPAVPAAKGSGEVIVYNFGEYLDPEDADLRTLTDSAIEKLEAMSDEEYAALDLTPDFDEEEENAE